MIGDAQTRRYEREFGWTFLGKKEYAQELAREKRTRAANWQQDAWGDCTERQLDRVARNCLISRKVVERPDYGPLADVRELIALRLAPWLRL